MIRTPSDFITQLIYTRHAKDFLFISSGVIMASIGLKGFLLPNNFLDGGAMGMSLLVKILTNVDLSLLIIVINLPFILLGARQISISFSIKSRFYNQCVEEYLGVLIIHTKNEEIKKQITIELY